jgi:hypothetical protein
MEELPNAETMSVTRVVELMTSRAADATVARAGAEALFALTAEESEGWGARVCEALAAGAVPALVAALGAHAGACEAACTALGSIISSSPAGGRAVVGKDGAVLKRYAPTDTPKSLGKDIDAALAA